MDFDQPNSRNLTVPENWNSTLFDQEYEQRPLAVHGGSPSQYQPRCPILGCEQRPLTVHGGFTQSIPASILDPPVRTATCAENSKRKAKVERKKMQGFGLWKLKIGLCKRWKMGLFY